jgi:HlyD family secretion protein
MSRRTVWPFVVGLTLVGALVYAFLPAPVDVDVATVTRGLLRVTVDQEGKTRIKEKYVVSAPLAGRLVRVAIHAGDAVTAGKTVLTAIEPTDPALLDTRARAEAEARVKAAEASRKRALATVEREKEAAAMAKHDYDRARTLLPARGIAQEEVDRAEHKERVAQEELRAAQFAVLIAEFELEQARAALVRTQPREGSDPDAWRFDIRSPINGTVLRVFQESATVVTSGTRLLELGDPVDLECEIDVLSTDAVKIVSGAPVLLEHWGGEQPLLARVRVVEPAAFMKVSALGVEEQRVWVIADFIDPPATRQTLGDGYRVEARIVVWERDNVLKVPAGALFRHEGAWAVFAVERGRARLRAVRVGKSNGLETEMLDGLQVGDLVILYPSDRIRDGMGVVSRSRRN